jgi:30S ribosomal protein S31
MGKGDKRTRRGKIFAGSFGKTRPKRKKVIVKPAETKPAKKKGK